MIIKMGNSKSVTSNLIWRFLERCGAQGVTLIVSLVLARILDPEVFGTVSLVSIFTTIMYVFLDSGLGTALIQKKDADDTDFSTVFYFNIVVGIIIYIFMFFFAPIISSFYHRPELTSIVRVMSLSIIVLSVKGVQQAYVSRHFIFKKFFWSTLGGTIGAAVVGITMAFLGFGVWAIVVQDLFNTFVDTVILWCTVKWRPKKTFSFSRLKNLFSYGWKLFVSGLLDVGYNKLTSLIIGKIYTSEDLAFYNTGEQFPCLTVWNIVTSIDSVLLPTMSNVQDDKEAVKEITRRSIKLSTHIIMPLMVGMAVYAEPLVRLVLTDKWLPCVPFMRIFCIIYAFYPVDTSNLNAIKALGRSDLFLKLEIIKKITGLIAIISTIWISVEALMYGLLVDSFISQIINSWPNRKLLGYKYEQQVLDMLPNILLSLFSGAIAYCVSFLHLNDFLMIWLQGSVCFIVYFAGSFIFHVDSFEYLFSMAKDYIKKKKQKTAESN